VFLSANTEIVSGDFRPVNLCSPPFLFPPPLQVINEASDAPVRAPLFAGDAVEAAA